MIFQQILNKDSGLSTRAKLNSMLSALIQSDEGVNAVWVFLKSLEQAMQTLSSKEDNDVADLRGSLAGANDYTDKAVNKLYTYVDAMNGGVGGLIDSTSYDPSGLPTDKPCTLIALGSGTFTNLKDVNNTAITVSQSNSITVFFRAAHITYWNYKTEVLTAPPMDATPTNGNTTHVVSSDGVYDFVMAHGIDDVDVADTTGSGYLKDRITFTMRKNIGTESEPEYETIASFTIPVATATKAGLMPAYVDGVFDVNRYVGSNTPYDSLSQVLNNAATLIPTAVRRGGMSIKFIQSSDNNYVQYRLMNNQWSTTASDWQGVDNKPIPNSNSLPKSGGVFNSIMDNCSAFDLTSYNNGETYTDLQEALYALNAMLGVYKRGGMSIKFKKTSTNKYEQYRLMIDTFSVNISDWQGIEDEVISGSKNLVNGGAVFSFQNKSNTVFNSIVETESVYNKTISSEENIYYAFSINIGDKYCITIDDIGNGMIIVGSVNSNTQTGFSEQYLSTSENGCYLCKASINATYFKIYSSGSAKVFIEKVVDESYKPYSHLTRFAITSTANSIVYKDLSFIESDKIAIKVANVASNSKLSVGFVSNVGDAGFSKTLLTVDGANRNEYLIYFDIKDSSDKVLKIYSTVDATQIEIHEIHQIKTSAPFLLATLTASQSFYQDISQVPVGDKVLIKVKGQEGTPIQLGFVDSTFASGFADLVLSGTLLSNEYNILYEVKQGLQVIKAYTTTSNVVVEVLNVLDKSTEIALHSVCYSSGEISTNVSYLREKIQSGDYYLIKLSNVPTGANITLGSQTTLNAAGYTETFANIQNAEIAEYDIVCKALQQANYFKFWASQSGINYEVWTNKGFVVATGSPTGHVVIGKDCYGGEHDYCVAIGSKTLENNTGVKNISIGNDNMNSCSGHDNTSMGYHSAFRLTSGIYNAAFGAESQDDITSGNNNTSLGFCSLQRNNTGSNNVAVGYFALDGVYDDRFDEQDQKGWNDNVAVGADAMKDAVRGSNDNVAVGKGALGSNKTYTNCIAIGKNADCTKNNQMVLGSSSITEVVVMGNKKLIFNQDGTVTWETLS